MPIRPPARDLRSYQDRFLVDLVESSYRQEVTSIVGHLLAMGMVVLFKGDLLPLSLQLAWPGALIAATGARLLLLHRHHQRGASAYRRRHLVQHSAGVITCAVVWALGFIASMPWFEVADVAFLMMVFAGITAGAVMTLAPRMTTFSLFVAILLGPPTALLLLSGIPSFMEIGAMALFFVVFCARGVRSANLASRAAWLRRYQNQDYVRDLANAKQELEEACQRSEDANQAKQQFLANISHEVRTPLNGILGMTSLVLDAPLEKQQREHMGTLKRCGDNLLRLVDDLLDFSRIEAGRMEIETIDFDLRVLLDELVEEHSLNALSKGAVEVRLEWAEAAPRRVIGDPVRLRQVLNNLLANAIKFTERGEVALCAWSSASPAGDQLVLQVADQGIGIPEDRRDAVFESFTQADGTTTRNYGGTGLGLAISRQLVELMGGCVTLESEVGIGSVFTVHLPLRLSADRTDVPPVQVLLAGVGECHADRLRAAGWGVACCPFDAELWLEARRLFRFPESQRLLGCSAEDLRANRGLVEALQRHNDCRLVVIGTDGDDGAAFVWNPEDGVESILEAFTGHDSPAETETRNGPLTVLLAEDDQTNALLARIHLEACGHLVHVARDGEEAVRMFRVLSPDLVLMDCQMPRVDGIEATRRIRALADGRDVPIVALTAHDRPEDRERFAAAGMDGHIRKPFERRALDAALQRGFAHVERAERAPKT